MAAGGTHSLPIFTEELSPDAPQVVATRISRQGCIGSSTGRALHRLFCNAMFLGKWTGSTFNADFVRYLGQGQCHLLPFDPHLGGRPAVNTRANPWSLSVPFPIFLQDHRPHRLLHRVLWIASEPSPLSVRLLWPPSLSLPL